MKFSVLTIVLLVSLGVHAEVRTWTLQSGKHVDAEYEKIVMDRVWLRNSSGATVKIPLSALSEDDRLFLELLNPPKLTIDFWDRGESRLGYYKGTPHMDVIPPSATMHSFRARVKLADKAEYHHELTVTYYAIGCQWIDRHKYFLVEKKTGSFIPTEKSEIELTGSSFKMLKYVMDGETRGRDYAFYLVTVTDERGEIIAHKESAKWLFEHKDALDKLPEGAYMDDTCTRVHPTGPEPNY